MGVIDRMRPYDQSTVLLADDEPEHLDWLVDYLTRKRCKTLIAKNVKETIEAAEKTDYRLYLIDLNIPFGGWTPPAPSPRGTYDDYHGLYIIRFIRSQGNSGDRVVAYSAHQNDQITGEMQRLYSNYVLKGRPRELKAEIDRLLAHDPRAKKILPVRKLDSARQPKKISKKK